MLIKSYEISCFPSDSNNLMILQIHLSNDYPEFKKHVVLADYNHKISSDEVDEFYYSDGYMFEVSYELKPTYLHKPKWGTLTGELYYIGDNMIVSCRLATKDELKLIKQYINEKHEELRLAVDLNKHLIK